MAAKHIVVTGGGTGIGRAIARRLDRDGASADAARARARAARGRRRRCSSSQPMSPRATSAIAARWRRRSPPPPRARPDPRARRVQRARRRQRRRRRGGSLRRPRRDEPERHVLLLPRRPRSTWRRGRSAAPRRHLVDPRAHRRAGLHGLQRLEGRPARPRALARGRARGGQRAGQCDLPRLGRHRHGVGRARRDRRAPAARARTPTGTRCAPCRSGGCPSRTTSPARSRGCSRPTRAASRARRSTRTAAPGWAETQKGRPRAPLRDVVTSAGLGGLVLRVGGNREARLLPRLHLLELVLGAHPHGALEPVLGGDEPPAAEEDQRAADRERRVVRDVPVEAVVPGDPRRRHGAEEEDRDDRDPDDRDDVDPLVVLARGSRRRARTRRPA